MKKQILFSLALLVAVSCIPVQAASKKSARDIFVDSVEILFGSVLVFNNAMMPVYDAATKETALEAARQAQEAEINQIRARGGDHVDDLVAAAVRRGWRNEANIEERGSFGVWKLVATAAGIALIYSGVTDFIQQDDQQKLKVD